MMSRTGTRGTLLCMVFVVGGCAASASKDSVTAAANVPPPSGIVEESLVTATAKVKKVDHKSRLVTLQAADGSEVVVRADERVRNLPQVKAGDMVGVTYYESLAYAVKKAGTAEPGAVVAEEAERAKAGQKPAGAAAQVISVTSTITAIDKKAGTVTLKGPEGNSVKVKARNPSNLERVAVGDLVELTYTEAVAIAVEAPAK